MKNKEFVLPLKRKSLAWINVWVGQQGTGCLVKEKEEEAAGLFN